MAGFGTMRFLLAIGESFALLALARPLLRGGIPGVGGEMG